MAVHVCLLVLCCATTAIARHVLVDPNQKYDIDTTSPESNFKVNTDEELKHLDDYERFYLIHAILRTLQNRVISLTQPKPNDQSLSARAEWRANSMSDDISLDNLDANIPVVTSDGDNTLRTASSSWRDGSYENSKPFQALVVANKGTKNTKKKCRRKRDTRTATRNIAKETSMGSFGSFHRSHDSKPSFGAFIRGPLKTKRINRKTHKFHSTSPASKRSPPSGTFGSFFSTDSTSGKWNSRVKPAGKESLYKYGVASPKYIYQQNGDYNGAWSNTIDDKSSNIMNDGVHTWDGQWHDSALPESELGAKELPHHVQVSLLEDDNNNNTNNNDNNDDDDEYEDC